MKQIPIKCHIGIADCDGIDHPISWRFDTVRYIIPIFFEELCIITFPSFNKIRPFAHPFARSPVTISAMSSLRGSQFKNSTRTPGEALSKFIRAFAGPQRRECMSFKTKNVEPRLYKKKKSIKGSSFWSIFALRALILPCWHDFFSKIVPPNS